ncbi:MAG: hypothetical protein FWC96_09900 [Oscillospiraceae bacterium]|nr:hypothetical protein [Oscillospiraceae bacterium]
MRYRRILSLLLLVAIILTTAACGLEQPDVPESILQVGAVWGDRHSLRFALRNISDITLFYEDGFRLYRYESRRWISELTLENNHLSGRIVPGAVSRSFVWLADMPTVTEAGYCIDRLDEMIADAELPLGRYMFVRRIFPDRHDRGNYKYLRIEFDIILLIDWHDYEQGWLNFITKGSPSENIVPIGEVEVSRTGIAFSLENSSDMTYTYGDSFCYENNINDKQSKETCLNIRRA